MKNRTDIIFLIIFFMVGVAWAEPQQLKLGAVYSLSGWAAIGGEAELNATKMAIEEINNHGGILGKKIELIVEDNQSDLRKTANAIQKLSAIDKVSIILGPNWAEFSDVAAPICEKNKVLMLTASGYTATLTEGKEYIFTTLPAHHVPTKPLSDYIAAQNHKKIAMATSISAYFESSAQAVREQLRSHGTKLSSDSTWNPATTDFKSYITKLKSEGFDALILMLQEGGDLAAFLKQAKDLNYTGKLYSSNALPYDEATKKNLEIAEDIIFYEYLVLATPEFLDKYKARHGPASSFSIPRAYDNVYLLKNAIERCKTFRSDELKECLRTSDFRGISGRIRFTKSGNIIPEGKQSALYTIKNGAIAVFNGMK